MTDTANQSEKTLDEIKPQAATIEDADDELLQKIAKQVDFWFGDVNLAKDKFMNKQISDNPDGWVALSVLLTFTRMKQMTNNAAVIAKAVKEHSEGGLIEVDDSEEHVRRTQPLPEQINLQLRTVYVKGFSKEDSTLDKLLEFFRKEEISAGYKVAKVEMRRVPKNQIFKGSVFVVMETEEGATALLGKANGFEDDKDPVVVRKLESMMQADYIKSKMEERKERKSKSKPKKRPADEDPDNQVDGSAPAEKKAKGEDGKPTNGVQEKKQHKGPMGDFVEGAVLAFENVGENATREMIKEVFGDKKEVAWVTYRAGGASGFIRFREQDAAKELATTLNGEIELNGQTAKIRALEGEEEQKYWDDQRKELQDKYNARKRGGGRGGRGKRGRRGGRR
eukprot:Clim_evm2s49 gene=Clim_evmTU2s49